MGGGLACDDQCMGIAGSGVPPYPLFQQALDSGSLQRVLNIARQMPSVSLRDALRIVELMRDEETYERAAVRWLGRLATEGRDVDLETIAKAALALDALPDQPDAAMRQLDAIVARCC